MDDIEVGCLNAWSFHALTYHGRQPGVLPPPTVLDPKATETTMALYQAMRATPDRLPKPRPKWKAWGPGFAWGVAVMGRV